MTLLEEIARGETSSLEFKEARPDDSVKFTKTVVAFANGRGGRLLFGVEDGTGRLVGIPREKVAREMDALVDTIANACTPPVSVDAKPAVVDGKALIAVDVRPGAKTPYYVKSLGLRKGTFVRVGATSRQAEEHTLKSLILEGENLSFDGQVVKDATLAGGELGTACRLMTDTARRNCRNDAERAALKPMTETRLASLGLVVRKGRKVLPTYAFRIVTGGDVPDILPPCIKCGCFRGTAKGDFADRRTCEGPLVDQIDAAFEFVVRNIRVGSELVGTARRDVYELPLDAIREAICNAAFHRDYLAPSCIYVALYADRLEVVSPGGLVRDITLEDALNGFSKIRNFKIGAALEYMKEVEGWGGGVSRFRESCKAMGLRPPKVEEEGGCFKVVFFRRAETADETINETGNETGDETADRTINNVRTINRTINRTIKEVVLEAIVQAPGIAGPQLMSATGRKRTVVTDALAALQREGKVEHRGSKKTGGYYPTGR